MLKSFSRSLKHRRSELPKHAFILMVLFFAFFPLYMIVNISFKTNDQFFNDPLTPTLPFHWENWVYGWKQVSGSIYVTIFLSFTSTAFNLTVSLCAAYFFGRYKMPGGRLFFLLFLMQMFIPGVVNLIPLFALLRELHLIGTFAGVIIPATAGAQVIAIYLLRNFIEDIPQDLFDSAQMDGAGDLRQIVHIVIPMCTPIIVTVAILDFINHWNDFVLPLVVLGKEELYPIGVRLYQLDGVNLKQWGPMMATYMIAAIPLFILFIFGIRVFVRGIGTGAIKG